MNKALSDGVVVQKTIGSFNFNIAVIFGLTVLSILYNIKFSSNGIEMVTNLWNPNWMLFGPFIYFANTSLTDRKPALKNIGLHLLPAFLFFIFFCIIVFHTDGKNLWTDPLYAGYQYSCFLIPVSLMGYALNVAFNRTRRIVNMVQADELTILICGLYFIIAVLYLLMYLCLRVLLIDMELDYRFFSYTLLLIIAIFIVRYTYLTRGIKTQGAVTASALNESSYANSVLREEQAGMYIQQIHDYFELTKAFLRSDLSLDVLSKELHIPKHYFSQLFNIYIGKSFYNFIAVHRINYAIQRLEVENGKLTIESLAYECGFNSRTSFNKYFKIITGYTPFEYLNQTDSKKNNISLK